MNSSITSWMAANGISRRIAFTLFALLITLWILPQPWKHSSTNSSLGNPEASPTAFHTKESSEPGNEDTAKIPWRRPGWRGWSRPAATERPAPEANALPATKAVGNSATEKARVHSSATPSTGSSTEALADTTSLRFKPSVKREETLIIYAYSETENAYENARFFITHGLHDAAHFTFIINGESPLLDQILPQSRNIETFRRENTCFDMGGYGHLIEEKQILASDFKKFILLNASIRGPFLPVWSKDCWSTLWLSQITDTMKLQGMTVNCARQFHVQSMIIGTDKEGLKTMVEDGTFNCPPDMGAAQGLEVGMAAKIMSHGWEINAWMVALHGDPSYVDPPNCASFGNDDHLFEGSYFGFDVHPYETIFIKANRNIDPTMLGKMTEWHDRMNYSSYDYC